MELAGTSIQDIMTVLVFAAGGFLAFRLSRLFGVSRRRGMVLYLWHTLFCFVFIAYSLDNTSDAMGYYKYSLLEEHQFSFGTDAVFFITALFSSDLGLSIVAVFLVYNIIGFVGLLAFDGSLRIATFNAGRDTRFLASLIVFLPSISFWSSAIGKDAVSFASVGIALWASLDFRRRSWLMFAAVALMLIVRPHIAVLMVIAVVASVVLHSHLSVFQRIAIGALAIGISTLIMLPALELLGLDEGANASSLAKFVTRQQGHNMQGGGAIDISTMPLPLQMFTYLFRPLPYEASGIAGFAASFDNMILLALFALGARSFLRLRAVEGNANRAFLWIYSISTWVALASTSSNLGISLRQKWMFVPMLIYLLISIIGSSRLSARNKAR